MDRTRPESDPCAGCGMSRAIASRDVRLEGGEAVAEVAGGVSVGSRRDFVRGTASALAGLLVGLGAPGDLAALPVHWASGREGSPDELTFPVPANDSVTVDRPNELILVRWSSRLYAFALSCPHQRSMLKWRDGDSMFQCTKHKSKYQPDGTYMSGRATRGMDRYPLRVERGNVVVRMGEAILQDEDAASWNAAVVDLDV